jgi:hypothetical protein
MTRMILELNPGAVVGVDGFSYRVEEHWSFFETDFRLDMVRLAGPSPAHERWLVAWQPEPYLMLVQRFAVDWLAPPSGSVVHEGELFVNVAVGTAHRVRKTRTGRNKEGRYEYSLFRANSGRVIVTIGHNEELEGWIGDMLPSGAITLP